MDIAGRTRWWRIAVTAAAIAQIWVFTVEPVFSAPATPGSVPTPGCDVPARTPDEIMALLAGPQIATPAATTDGQILPAGALTDADVAATMTRVVQIWLACQNAAEPLRAWSLFSDGYLYRLLSRLGGVSGEAFRALATPAPVADEAERTVEDQGEPDVDDPQHEQDRLAET